MWPSPVSTKGRQVVLQVVSGFSGSRLGIIQGFTHLGCTGMMLPVGRLPTFPELEGLKASAVAVALTVFPVFPQIREKKVGKPARLTCTVTIGFTPNAAGKAEQSAPVVPAAE